MSGVRKRATLIGVCAALAALACPAFASAGAAPVFVGLTPLTGHGRGCATPAYSSIQAAIDAVGPGTKIEVCEGTYVEQLTVEKGLQIRAARHSSVTVESPGTSRISAASGSCAEARGEDVELMLCTPATVELAGVTVKAPLPEGAGCRSGVAVRGGATFVARSDAFFSETASSLCLAADLRVGGARQTGHLKLLKSAVVPSSRSAGIVAEGEGSGLAVSKSNVVGDDFHTHPTLPGVLVAAGASASIKGSTVTHFDSPEEPEAPPVSAVVLEAPAAPVSLAHNSFLGDGVAVSFRSGAAAEPPSAELEVVHNHFQKCPVALSLEQGHVLLSHDLIEEGEIGIRVIQTAAQPFALHGEASHETITGMTVAAVDVESDGSRGDAPGELLIERSAISGNAAEVINDSPDFTVTKSHDT